MFGWKEVLDTQDQQIFSKKKGVLLNADVKFKVKHKFDAVTGGMGRGRVQFGDSGARNKATYRLLVRKDDFERARSLIYNK